MRHLKKPRMRAWRDELPALGLIAFLILVFATGGSARSDIASLVVLRPLAGLACAAAILGLSSRHVVENRFLFSMAAALLGVVALHLLPLPPGAAASLPGREIVREIDLAAGTADVWRPLSMVPATTLNALFALLVPLAVLLIGVQLPMTDRGRLLPVLIAFAALSAFVGLLQSIGSLGNFYPSTSDGMAVGLFANRNHQAITLALTFPMLATYASMPAKSAEVEKLRTWLSAAVGLALIPLILVTGSRTGLLIGLVGIGIAVALFRRQPTVAAAKKRRAAKIGWPYALAAFVFFSLVALTVIMARAEALQRLIAGDPLEDKRFKILGPILEMAWKYFPFGSGAGSYVEIFQIDEPYDLLTFTYSNHAHNDWVETLLTMGLPGVALLTVATIGFFFSAHRTFGSASRARGNLALARLGYAIVGMLGLASMVDYPLRTPTLGSVFVIAALWTAGRPESQKKLAPEMTSS